jgi:hypothetical protein
VLPRVSSTIKLMELWWAPSSQEGHEVVPCFVWLLQVTLELVWCLLISDLPHLLGHHPHFDILRAWRIGRACLWNHPRIYNTCSGVSGDQIFREHITQQLGANLHLLPGGRLQDCTMNTFLHRLWTTTSSNVLYRLVRMEPPEPSALVPPWGILLILLFLCLVINLCCLR